MLVLRGSLLACAATFVGVFSATAAEPAVIPLWEQGAPGFEERRNEPERAESYWVRNVHFPTITAFLPAEGTATGAAVLVCPGGGHKELVFQAEGVDAARYLAQRGVAAFALKYRLGREEGSPYKIETHARQDGQRAMRLIRSRCTEWGIDPTRIGMLGFSAGGEVVSLTAFAAGNGNAEATDPIERASSRPDFVMDVYPGPLGIPDVLPDDAPPAFFIVANDDYGAAFSITALIDRYRAANVPFEAHLLARGGHAFNMGQRARLVTLKNWPQRMDEWMADNFILDPAGREEYAKQVQQARERARRFREQRQNRDKTAKPQTRRSGVDGGWPRPS